ncbi:hypothetical protein M0D21_03285 [Aquimarina sp. D1M17]|uniref:hypothetical protein n=1 Tax=Aquimarina acroporae TaxID=2937283 RepID=UPI0020BD5C49|nr:hypothetical protein [Aquimarina acroporae]MCK8520575.1 hypothetical protein [Aquimarina acroporae]
MNSGNFKISISKIVKFVIIILVIDFALGYVARQLFFSQETGKYARSTHAIEHTDAKVIILGSSHAHRHYVPEVFENELKTTCYNAGAEGQQLLYHSVMQKMILKRTKPDVLVLNIDEDFLYSSKEAYDRLGDLHPYYGDHKDELRPVLKLQSKLVDVKMFFKSYQTNSTLVHVFRYYLSPQVDYKGYRPLFGKVNPEKLNGSNEEHKSKQVIDSNFVNAFKSFIKTAKDNNVRLVLVTSPALLEVDHSKNESFNKIKEIANDKNVMFVDFFNDKQFVNQYKLFHDPSHLNDDGARLFSRLLSERIRQEKWIKN